MVEILTAIHIFSLSHPRHKDGGIFDRGEENKKFICTSVVR